MDCRQSKYCLLRRGADLSTFRTHPQFRATVRPGRTLRLPSSTADVLVFQLVAEKFRKGQLFLVDLNRMAVYDEYPAEGIVHLRWSPDGSKAYAIANDGLAYIDDPPLI